MDIEFLKSIKVIRIRTNIGYLTAVEDKKTIAYIPGNKSKNAEWRVKWIRSPVNYGYDGSFCTACNLWSVYGTVITIRRSFSDTVYDNVYQEPWPVVDGADTWYIQANPQYHLRSGSGDRQVYLRKYLPFSTFIHTWPAELVEETDDKDEQQHEHSDAITAPAAQGLRNVSNGKDHKGRSLLLGGEGGGLQLLW